MLINKFEQCLVGILTIDSTLLPLYQHSPMAAFSSLCFQPKAGLMCCLWNYFSSCGDIDFSIWRWVILLYLLWVAVDLREGLVGDVQVPCTEFFKKMYILHGLTYPQSPSQYIWIVFSVDLCKRIIVSNDSWELSSISQSIWTSIKW